MSDSYQAVYDAVRSRIHACDVSDVVRQAVDLSHLTQSLQQEFMVAAGEMMRPSVLWRPSVAPDGNQWCALYGPNLMEGVCGYGDTPEAAMRAFDAEWLHGRCGAGRSKP